MSLKFPILLGIAGAVMYIGGCVNAAARNIVSALSELGKKIDDLNDKADLIASKADDIEFCVSGKNQAYLDKIDRLVQG